MTMNMEGIVAVVFEILIN